MKSTVVVLLSDKRSGSTYFQRELLKHGDVQTVEYSSHRYLETHHWLKSAMILNPMSVSMNLYKGYGSISNAKTLLIDTIKGNVPNWNVPTNNKDLVFEGWEALCKTYANPVFFEKSPQLLASSLALSLFKSWIANTEFEVKIIALVRNPLAVLYSAQELFHTSPEKRQFGWKDMHQNLIDFSEDLTKEQFMLLRYEDLVLMPQEHFNRVCTFIGIEPRQDMGKDASRNSLDLWKVDPDFDLNLAPAVIEMAQQFGYTLNDLTNPPKPKKKRKIFSSVSIRKRWNYMISKMYFHYYQPFILKWKSRKIK